MATRIPYPENVFRKTFQDTTFADRKTQKKYKKYPIPIVNEILSAKQHPQPVEKTSLNSSKQRDLGLALGPALGPRLRGHLSGVSSGASPWGAWGQRGAQPSISQRGAKPGFRIFRNPDFESFRIFRNLDFESFRIFEFSNF